MRHVSIYRRFGKRAFDLMVAIPALVALSPVIAVVALLIRCRLGRPVVFRQTRGGRDDAPFELIKFRTMADIRGTDGALLPDHQRLSALGRILRALSIDELPELVNVARGDMSLVGPRPFIFDYMPHYTPAQRRRHEVRPGITGLAQVMGRNGLSWEERFAYDIEYLERLSFRVDLRILLRTLLAVVGRRGVNETDELTSGRFDASAAASTADDRES